MSNHDLSVPNECPGRQALEGVSHHFVGAQRHEPSKDEFTHVVLANVNVTREFPVHWILAHSNAGMIVFIEKSGFSLGISKISKRFLKVDRFLASLASRDKFSHGSGK